MTKNNRANIVITNGLIAAAAALLIMAASCVSVHAYPFRFEMVDLGNTIAIRDVATGKIIDMDTFHDEWGYQYDALHDRYVLQDETNALNKCYICNCEVCVMYSRGYIIYDPRQDNNSSAETDGYEGVIDDTAKANTGEAEVEATDDTASVQESDNDNKDNGDEAAGTGKEDGGKEDGSKEDNSDAGEDEPATIYLAGTELSEDTLSGSGWKYDPETDSLTLDFYKYEGSGLFAASEEDAEDESGNAGEADGDKDDIADSDGEDAEDGEDEDGEDEEEEFEEEEFVEEEYEDAEDDGDEGAPEDADNSKEGGEDEQGEAEDDDEPVKGVIYSDGDLTLRLNGESYITITDEGSDASYAVNVEEELRIEGDGVLYIKTATEEKVYGNEPKKEEPSADDSEDIKGDINTNTNDIDNTQTVNEAPVTQTVDDGDVNVSNNNNVELPDISNNISLSGANNIITFNPTIEVRLPENKVEKTVLSGMQSRYPEVVRSAGSAPVAESRSNAGGDIRTASKDNGNEKTENDAAVSGAAEDGTLSGAPETGDSLDLGVLLALIATVVIGGTTGGIMLYRRIRGY